MSDSVTDAASAGSASNAAGSDDAVRSTVEAIRVLIHETHAGFRSVVDGMPTEALDWAPGQDTNSIGVLLVHSLESERSLCASVAGLDLPRDREASFRSRELDVAALRALVVSTEITVDGYLDAIGAAQLTAEVRRGEHVRTGATWLVRAAMHAREHLGQATLTRQLAERRGAGVGESRP